MIQTISRRQLNRTFLQRQFLLERSELSTVSVISRVIALQSQAANSPYEALWSRVKGFQPADLDLLYKDREVARATWFRSTVHTTVSSDFIRYRNLHSGSFSRGLDKQFPGLELTDKLGELKDAYVAADTVSGKEMASIADSLMPGQSPETWNSHSFKRAIPMVRHPSGQSGRTRGSRDPWAEAESYLGSPLETSSRASLEELLVRYLEGYGPASAADAGNFLGLTKLGPVFRSMGLLEYRGEDGSVLYDNPGAILADSDIEPPSKLMASFDHTILGHSDRSRIIDPGYGKILSGVNAVFKPYILLDGRVEGYWSYGLGKNGPEVKLRYFKTPSESQESELFEEAKSWCETWFGTDQIPLTDSGLHQ